MESRSQRRPGRRDLHFLNADGMVACNPRDREAAHRAEMGGIATGDPKAVTCRKCRNAIRSEGTRPSTKRDERIWEDYWQGDEDRSWWENPAPEVLDFIEEQSPEERPDVLDLGCGLGRHAIAFAQAGFSVTGADASEAAIKKLAGRAEEHSLRIRCIACDVLSTALPESGFDIVLAYNVIYHGHREDFAAAIARTRLLLKPRGLLWFTCPSRRDGKYGHGPEVAPHTFLCERSVTPGDIHYFADKADLDDLLADFEPMACTLSEGHWDNRGNQQFFSNWHILALKS